MRVWRHLVADFMPAETEVYFIQTADIHSCMLSGWICMIYFYELFGLFC